jgi:hypothetical protein
LGRIKALPATIFRFAMIGGLAATIIFVLDALLLDHEDGEDGR